MTISIQTVHEGKKIGFAVKIDGSQIGEPIPGGALNTKQTAMMAFGMMQAANIVHMHYKAMLGGYGELHDGLSDMIEGGRLVESDIPVDYQWLTDKLEALSGNTATAHKTGHLLLIDDEPKPDKSLNERELATVLAALRMWQHEPPLDHEDEIATDGGKLEPLTDEEIDELCERLNMEG